ncbi:isochorismate synthase MenF [Streptomyces sp. R11]|uniref:isochorismate synthase n=1 Tax=Streptomyces sp. R11 TaxID=3238625 RepID=A0AB39NBQ0_9ACTN
MMKPDRPSAARILACLDLSLEHLLKTAHRRAQRIRRPVLTSASVVLEDEGTLQHLLPLTRHMPQWTSFASEAQRIVTWGAAARIRDNADLFSVKASWSELVANAVRDELTEQISGPILIFGRSFAEEHNSQGLWRLFGRSRAIVPWISIREHNNRLVATASVVVGQNDAPLDAGRGQTEPSSQAPPPPVDAETAFLAAAEKAIARLRLGEAEKVVLARSVRVETGATDPLAILGRLDVRYPQTCRFAISLSGTTFLGATPELLCSVQGRTARTMALAGSIPAGAGDAAALSDPKLRREHSIVAEHIEQALRPRSDTITMDPEPAVVSLSNIRHLRTDFRATLTHPASVLDVAQWLHPTPAIGGCPTPEAYSLIRELEGFDRGWYTGPVGWTDAAGDGDCWVTLRCALLTESAAYLFAGAGIVRDSDPTMELAETNWKLAAMLEALGLLPPEAERQTASQFKNMFS